MLEKNIEKGLRKAVIEKGGLCLKFVSPSMAGVPDRLVLMPYGKLGFVEVKQKGEVPRPLQLMRMKQLSKIGYPCFVLDDIGQIPEIIKKIGGDAT
ncbi:VRR-NUC domain-containing protein [Lactococcus garvieae]|uniref:VRR-NUC domain-containing protein n=1 Tax=Lactococcus garvieae TaxID=1363 RepID=UPI0013FE0DB9|nr:VRR-NUC domain-containing protein [Lactococcus garvieae]NHI69368.1 VRR-NUC domain-containing protein [Lactococcus garvieae]NHJ06477.1 VRR-NUC domain-containing protein [Lactococcus garvieae]